MDGSIALRGRQRNGLLELYRRDPDPAVRLRAHIILLLAENHPWSLIAAVLFCSSATIARWKERFEAEGVRALRQQQRGRPSPLESRFWIGVVVAWVQRYRPRDFGFLRSRWCCATLVLVLLERQHLKVCAETVRRWLAAGGLVWRRPRPVLGLKDPRRQQKLRHIRSLLRHLADDEIAMFCDEVDLSTNPKVGGMWMKKGRQAQLPTPGDSVKRYLCGSMNWRSGEIVASEGTGRNSSLFLAHLDELRRRYRCYKTIHVICDNAGFHRPDKCKAVAESLAQGGQRVKLHFLPTRAPETNPIERVWWHLHEQITRNHRCQSIGELVDLVLQWLEQRGPFAFEGHLYADLRAALAKP
jgi:putative transposase